MHLLSKFALLLSKICSVGGQHAHAKLSLQKGLREGLTGRFEILRSTHWTLRECEGAFGYALDNFLFFGGYPGSVPLKSDEQRWLDTSTTPWLTRASPKMWWRSR